MSATAQEPIALPAEDAPETGDIAIGDVVISTVDHWVADGLHVFRSREFDVIAEHEDEFEAVRVFVESAADFAYHLADLISERQATEHEIETATVLVPRFMRLWEDSDRALREAQRRILNLPRHGSPRAQWHRRSTQSSSSQPLPA